MYVLSLEYVEKEEFPTAMDENGFRWIKVPCPDDGTLECWACEKRLYAKKITEEDEDMVAVGEHCWYSVQEATLYCLNCITEPTLGS